MNEQPKQQLDKFKDLARELECSEDEDAFKAKLRKIAKAPPAPQKAKREPE